ncbi:MAG: hypothetical protein AB7O98_03145 [Hyphomonadaceae bacterium]
MSLTVFARVAKLVALLGFFLPWVTVSCSGTEILQATGWQLMTGDVEASGALAGVQSDINTDDAEPAPLVIAAFAVIALALVGSVLLRARAAAGVVLAGALLGASLSWYSVENLRTEMRSELGNAQHDAEDTNFLSREQQVELAERAAEAIKVEEQQGYWVTILALAVAALLSGAALAGVTISGPPPKPDANPG